MKALIALALLLAAPQAHAAAAPAAAPDPDQVQVDRAADLIQNGKPGEAVAVLDPLIAAQQRERADDDRTAFCARSPVEASYYAGQAAQQKKRVVVLPQSSCYSIFLKGFALIDLNRSDEAKAYLERAVAMAPSNSHFLGELGEWYKNRHDLDQAWTYFTRASDASEMSPPERKTFDKTRALRGQGWILVERGKLDEAEQLYRRCLELNPDDSHAKSELEYIAQQRAKRPRIS
jgi:tetratricopeptide (TPR) repeat protein